MKLMYRDNGFKDGDYKKDLDLEIKILGKLNECQNSIKYYGYYETKEKIIIILEKCDKI